MANKVGTLIKKARTDAGYTQEQLARKVKNLSASELSKAERGELELPQSVLREIAIETGVTQSSLIEAAKHSSYKKGNSSSSSSSSTQSSMKVSATEKKLVNAYRKADSDTKKKVRKLLLGTDSDTAELIEDFLGTAIDLLSGKK